MIGNIVNDDIVLTNVNKPAVVEKVAPVPVVAPIMGAAENGNHQPANTATSVQTDVAKQEASSAELDETVRDLNEHMQAVKRELHFSVDQDSGHTVIKVMDLATQEVIRQIPNEEALKAARSLGEGFDIKLFSEYT